ncbi:uncharacterized protein LOC124775145 [Schistocerca piceifrons]|uniref:uncharacterized protein LOC124775145 n=1 Tax=Schistocerca piceifrons TaxID=274613 RepID=UPI001F5FA309|nr:uncharacterized protein LOC124775145 [Schistocerca piceifrons]
MKVPRGYTLIIAVYDAADGREDVSEKFHDILGRTLHRINKNYYLTIATDISGRVHDTSMANVIVSERKSVINDNGYRMKKFSLNNELRISYAFFMHEQIHKYTWKIWPLVQDARAFRGPDASSDHFLQVPQRKELKRWRNTSKQRQNNADTTIKEHLLREKSTRVEKA